MNLTFYRYLNFRKMRLVLIAEVAVAALIVLIDASLGRPVWIDEFLHFCFGAMRSTAEAWQVIKTSTKEVNHGQTGFYMLLDHWLLSSFGASAVLLRLPSLISGLLLFVSTFYIFRLLGRVTWQVIALLALLGQGTLIFFVGEARPYISLVAATVAVLAFYLVPPQERTGWTRSFGWFAALFGVAMHPYFAVYWPALCLVSYVHHRITGQITTGLRNALSYADVLLCVVGAVFFMILSLETWLPGGPTFSTDPFEFIGEPNIWVHFSGKAHFQFLRNHLILATAVTVVLIGWLVALPLPWRGSLLRLWPPFLLLAAALIISLLLGYASYVRHYWILPRQWVASAALVAIAVVWLWAEIAEAASKRSRVLPVVLWALAFTAVFLQAAAIQRLKVVELVIYLSASKSPDLPVSCDSNVVAPNTPDNDERNRLWVELANRNIACGGKVWPVFREYYGLK